MKKAMIAVMATLLAGTGYYAYAQDDEWHRDRKPKMARTCQQMMDDKKMHMRHFMEFDEKIDALVMTMDRATGSEKAEATSMVVKELVSQRKATRLMKEEMEMKGMMHMSQHMKSGSWHECSMMKAGWRY